MAGLHVKATWKFQSTHPVRGAMVRVRSAAPLKSFQSTHPVRGATAQVRWVEHDHAISIHAPREGCDTSVALSDCASRDFNPRTP